MKLQHYLFLGSLAVNLVLIAFWCPLHKIFPCDGTGNGADGPATSVETTVEYDSTEYQLSEKPALQQQEQQWMPYVSAIETENERLEKELRASQLTNTLLMTDLETLLASNQEGKAKADSLLATLTKADTNALVHKSLFERFSGTRVFREDSVAEVSIYFELYQNRLTAMEASFKNLAPKTTNKVTNHYRDRFKFALGGSVAVLTDYEQMVQPFGGVAMEMKFKSGTTVVPSYMVGDGDGAINHLIHLAVLQELRFPRIREAMERRKAKRAIKKSLLLP